MANECRRLQKRLSGSSLLAVACVNGSINSTMEAASSGTVPKKSIMESTMLTNSASCMGSTRVDAVVECSCSPQQTRFISSVSVYGVAHHCLQ